MVVPPFTFSDSRRISDYSEGYTDGATAPTPPVVPVIPRPTPDKTYTVGAGGFANLDLALTQAAKDGAKLPLFQFVRGQTFTTSTNVGGGNITAWNGALFDAAPGDGPLPVFNVPTPALVFLRCPNPQVRNLVVTCSVPHAPGMQGLYFDSCPGILLDNVTVNGFAFGASIVGNGNAALHIYRCNWLYQDSGDTTDSSGLYVQGIPQGDTAEIGGCLFLRCGLPVGYVYGANPAIDNTLGRKHGIYGNESPQGVYGQLHVFGNVFVDCASRGIGSRRDGVYEWNVFRSNGTAADINFGNAGAPGGTGTIQDTAFFGPGVDSAPFWGGGVECNSTNVIAQRLYGFSNSKTQRNALVRVTWDSTPTTATPAGHGPLPPNTTATIDQVHGVWPTPSPITDSGRSSTLGVWDVRPPNKGESLPTLAAFYGIAEADLYLQLRVQGAQDAAAIVDWARRSWTAMKNPPVAPPITPLPVPAAFDVTVTIDPAAQTILQKK